MIKYPFIKEFEISTLSKSFITFFIFIITLFMFFIFVHSKIQTKSLNKEISTITNSSNLVFNNSYIFQNTIYEDQQKINYKGFVYHE